MGHMQVPVRESPSVRAAGSGGKRRREGGWTVAKLQVQEKEDVVAYILIVERLLGQRPPPYAGDVSEASMCTRRLLVAERDMDVFTANC